MTFQVCALSLGGNIGDSKAQLSAALNQLHQNDCIDILSVSRLYKTPPWGKTDQAEFLNACALIQTTLAAEKLLETCLAVETALGRERIERWGPRVIDIDLLLYGDMTHNSVTLTLPHPRMTERAFVMVPLCDIAPDLHVGGKSVSAWCKHIYEGGEDGIEAITDNGDWWL